jgi:hypothetical protein
MSVVVDKATRPGISDGLGTRSFVEGVYRIFGFGWADIGGRELQN